MSNEHHEQHLLFEADDPRTSLRLWELGVERVTRIYERLAPPVVGRAAALVAEMQRRKAHLQEIALSGGAAQACADCRGACCASGRYHFTGVDLLAYLLDGLPLFEPRFSNGLCPFLGEAGCLVPVPYRPFNCITFNCDRIEDRLDPDDVSRFYRLEGELRGLYREVAALFSDCVLSRAVLNLPLGTGGRSIDGGFTHGDP